jgi:hypothetical protein
MIERLLSDRAFDEAEEIKEYANLGAFPATGLTNVIYIASDTNLIYRWDGGSYQAVGGTTVGTQYLGLWDANTNTPTITSSTHAGAIGDFYFVSPGGATLIDGVNTWDVGDAIIWNGATWERLQLAGSAGVGQKAQTVIFSAGSNEYFTRNLAVSFDVWGSCKFEGTSIIGTPSAITLVLQKPTASINPSWGVRIYDVTNAQVIASDLGNAGNISFPKQLFDMGALSNLSATPAIWEIQFIKTGGGQQQLLLSSLTIEY